MSLTRVDIDVCLTKNVPICYIITPWKYQVCQCGSKKLMRYWQFHIIKWKKSKVLSHLRDFRIETYLEKACYLGSLWLVGSQETQKWTKIKSALLTKMRHGKPLWAGLSDSARWFGAHQMKSVFVIVKYQIIFFFLVFRVSQWNQIVPLLGMEYLKIWFDTHLWY